MIAAKLAKALGAHLQCQAGRVRRSGASAAADPILANIAAIITASASVAPAGDALFPDMPGQPRRLSND